MSHATDADTDADQPTFRLMYRSHSLIPAPERKAQLGAIFSTARRKNKTGHVTGALMVFQDWFVQVLEGEESTVRSLYERIGTDERHEDVTLVEAENVDGRVFGRWAMAQVSEGDEPDIPLIMNSTKGGAVAAAARPTTPEQEPILDKMRDSLREHA